MNARITLPTNLPSTAANRAIGDILVATGRLSADKLQRILDSQKKDQLPFGEAALALKLLTQDDINFALSQQFDYTYLSPTDTSLSPQLVAAYKPFSRVGENLRAVRSQLMLRWFNGNAARKALAVVSADAGEGRSFIAANLAIVFAQQGQRTLLVDADLRATSAASQQALFKLVRGPGLSDILANRATLQTTTQNVPSLPNLALLSAGAVPPNPQELLGRADFDQLLQNASAQFDVILIDTPAAAAYADAEIVAARTGAALLVARKNASLLPKVTQLARRLQDGGVALVGTVLNDA